MLAQSTYRRAEKLEKLRQSRELYEEVMERGDCISLKKMAVSGRDLIEAGMKPGKELGETLERLLELVLREPEKNTKEYLLSRI